jgi:thiol-disulfide isomerase/thioredoxin
MQRRHLLRSGLLLTGAAAAGSLALVSGLARPGGRTAPEFTGIADWMNTTAPVSLAASRGKVVLVNFWTYSCINCRRTIPYLKRWQSEYGNLGFRIIGIHTPEFAFEHDRANVETYVRQTGIVYQVGQDNSFASWEAWDNTAWPGFYVLDRDGRVILVCEGEDHAHEMEGTIRGLLGLSRTGAFGLPDDDPDLSRIGSPETYFGSIHPTPQDGRQSPRLGEAEYSFVGAVTPRLNEYQLSGIWSRDGEPLVLRSSHGALRLRFSAAKIHLVATAPKAATVRIRLDGRQMPNVEISWPTLYTLVDGETYGEHLLELEADAPGLALFSATFG